MVGHGKDSFGEALRYELAGGTTGSCRQKRRRFDFGSIAAICEILGGFLLRPGLLRYKQRKEWECHVVVATERSLQRGVCNDINDMKEIAVLTVNLEPPYAKRLIPLDTKIANYIKEQHFA